MPYTQLNLDGVAAQIGTLLDDTNELYWVRQEKYLAIWEAMRIWGGYTQEWKARGAIPLSANNPFYDLHTYLPALRSRYWTLDQVVRDIQYMLLENPGSVLGTGMSGQISVASILTAIQRARNRFVLDAMIPLQVDSTDSAPPSPDGMCSLPQDTIYIHRASWLDSSNGIYRNLWRQDAWTFDHAAPTWTTDPSTPYAYSEAETAQLQVQLYPIPLNEGFLELISVQSLFMDLTNPAQTFNIPDEWIHGVKYGALSNLLNVESQMFDPLRAQYAEMRYQQAVTGAKGIKSVIRVLLNNQPLPLDSFASIDAAKANWRNQTGRPHMAGAMHDFLMFAPVPDGLYGCTVDVVRAAPLPNGGADLVQVGLEDIDNIINYACHMLTFKCGGNEFKSTFAHYDGFMSAIAQNDRVNKVQVQYLTPTFGQPAKETALRPEARKK